MAAEYSRQLSDKVFHGSVRVSRDGFSAGGPACYGLGRLLLDMKKNPVRVLKPGEHKQVSNERVTFIPLDNQETRIVKEIFRLFVQENVSPSNIAHRLNHRASVSAGSMLWNRNKIIRILCNEAYIGTRVYNKTCNRLRQGRRKNPRSDWVKCPQAFPAIVDKRTFAQAQQRFYWYTFKRWGATLRALDQAKDLVRRYLLKIADQCGLKRRELLFLLDDCPIVFSTDLSVKRDKTHWCFVLSERMRSYSAVLSVGVTVNLSSPIAGVLLIPVSEFGRGGACMVTVHDEKYEQWLVAPERLETTIRDLLAEAQKGYPLKKVPAG